MGQPLQSVIHLDTMVMGRTALWSHCIHLSEPRTYTHVQQHYLEDHIKNHVFV